MIKAENEHPRFFALGVGPGDPGLLTLRAAEILRAVDRIFYVEGRNSRESISCSVVESLGNGIEVKLRGLVFSMAPELEDRRESWRRNAEEICNVLAKGLDCAFATIGDPLLFSTFVYILPYIKDKFPEMKIEIVPGITSFQAAAAAAGMPLAMNDEILTIVPAWKSEYLSNCLVRESDSLVCMKTYRTRNQVAKKLREDHRGDFLYASHVGHEDEVLVSDADKIAGLPEEYLSLIISRKKKGYGS